MKWIFVSIVILAAVSIPRSVHASCGGTFTNDFDRGFIISPNNPSPYGNNEFCKWSIRVDQGYVIKLSFYDPFQLEYDITCSRDKLKVFDFLSNGTRVLQDTWCGTKLPPEITSTSSRMDLEFTSNGRNTYRGFSAAWDKIVKPCVDVLEGTEGTLESPSYGKAYPNNIKCRWNISVPTGRFVTLSFNSTFDLGTREDTTCEGGDAIEIFDVFGNNSVISRGRWCGTQRPPLLTSFGNRMLVEFKTDEDNANGYGFYAYWRADTNCDDVTASTSGFLMSYNYGSNAVLKGNTSESAIRCARKIVAPKGFRIKLKFEPSTDAGYCDEFQVGEYLASDKLFYPRTQWCASNSSNQVTSESHELLLVFDPQQDFYATWSSVCGNVYHDMKGNLTTPNYPLRYTNNLDCRWEILSNNGNPIILQFDQDFDIEGGELGCEYDYVEVFDNVQGNLVSKGRYCGSQTPSELISYYAHVVVVFHSDGDKTRRGLSMSWSSESSCGGVLDGQRQGTLTFPNIITTILPNITCEWKIFLESWVHYTDMNFLTRKFDLGKARVEVATDRGFYKMITGNLRTNHWTQGNVTVTYIPDGSDLSGTGFDMTWRTFCGWDSSATTGSLSSPNYGMEYPANLNCTWTISATKDHKIHLYFGSTFEIEHSNNDSCEFDYVEVFDYPNGVNSVSLGRFCGNNVPPTLISSSSTVMVYFRSDENKSGNGFSLSWDAACGEIYRSNTGSLTTPNYPSAYPDSFDCSWVIQAQEGYVIRLSFQTPFSLEDNSHCLADYVEVFDVKINGTRVSQGRWCGRNPPPMQISTASKMVVKFHSDNGKSYAGFQAKWDSVCGDVMEAPQGVFTSPEYPLPYPSNLDCRWEIKVVPGQRVKLQFGKTFDLEMSRDNCGYDDVEVLDYFSNGTVVSYGRWCSVNEAPILISSSSRLLVLFHSDEDKSGRGFKATYETVSGCGDTFYKNEGFLMSSNYPSNYPENQACRWEIYPVGGANITLTFDGLFDLEHGDDCAWDYVEVYQGNTKLGRWCGLAEPTVVTTTEKLEVLFVSDKSTTGKGFFASWTTVS